MCCVLLKASCSWWDSWMSSMRTRTRRTTAGSDGVRHSITSPPSRSQEQTRNCIALRRAPVRCIGNALVHQIVDAPARVISVCGIEVDVDARMQGAQCGASSHRDIDADPETGPK